LQRSKWLSVSELSRSEAEQISHCAFPDCLEFSGRFSFLLTAWALLSVDSFVRLLGIWQTAAGHLARRLECRDKPKRKGAPGSRNASVSRCRSLTKHMSFSVRYNAAPSDSNRILKTFRWVCSRCGEEAEVTSDVLVPSDRARFIARILRMQDDYDIRSMSILADCGQLRIQIAFGNTGEEST
jgi:hypothetical protein